MESRSFMNQRSFQGAESVSWKNAIAKNYLVGDIDLLSKERRFNIEVRSGLLFPYPTSLVVSHSRFAFRRSWNHIQSDREDFFIVRYILRGSLSFTTTGEANVAPAGSFMVSRSTIPFRYEVAGDNQTPTKFLFVYLPAHLLHRHLPNGIPLNRYLTPKPNQQLASPTILSLLCTQGKHLDRQVIDHLITTLLKEIEVIADQQDDQRIIRQTLGEKRISDILSYMTLHLSNPTLSLATVAGDCGISSRYLSYLLKMQNTTFSQLLWEERLKNAREILIAIDKKQYTISEIASMVGFKSAAHFSRAFRKRFNLSPREFRANEGQNNAPK